MKVRVKAVIDEDKSVNLEIVVGRGDKTFKWLGSVVTHRFSLTSNPNGSLRRREDYRGSTEHANYFIGEITLPTGEVPHPSSMIYDFLRDNDEVVIYIVTTQKLSHTRTPDHSQVLICQLTYSSSIIYSPAHSFSGQQWHIQLVMTVK